MRRIIMVLSLAAIMTAVMAASAITAFAVPSEENAHGSCRVGGQSPDDKGARGCAGNIGGHIDTQNRGNNDNDECENINRGPFNEGERSCGFVPGDS